MRLGFLGLCNRTGRQWNYQPFLDAGYDKPGFAYLLPDNLDDVHRLHRGPWPTS